MLVVDDQPDVASSTAEILLSAGLTATTAITVEEALEVMASCQVRAVIVDHHLAGYDGERFLAMGENRPAIVLMSGMGREALDELQDVLGAEVFACLAKPVPPVDLVKVVRAAIGSK